MKSQSTYSSLSESTDEYLSIAETAARLGLSAKRIRNLMAAGVFKLGYHFFRPRGIGPRFKWSRVIEWLEGRQQEADEAIPMARTAAGSLSMKDP